MEALHEIIEQSLKNGRECPYGTELVSVLDCQGTAHYVSGEHALILGFTSEELLGTCVFNLVHPDDIAKVMVKFTHMVQLAEPVSMEFRFRHKTSQTQWVHFRAEGVPLIANEIVKGFVVVSNENVVDLSTLMTSVEIEAIVRVLECNHRLSG